MDEKIKGAGAVEYNVLQTLGRTDTNPGHSFEIRNTYSKTE